MFITFFICANLEIANNYALWIGIGFLIIGGTIGIIKYKNIGFYLLSVALGFILFANSNNNPTTTINYSFASQPAIINGKVKSILKKESDKQRIIVEGNFSSKTLPTTYNTAILLTIEGTINKDIDIEIGDKVIIDAHIRPPKESVFKYDFDEVTYNKSIGTNWIGYTHSDKVYKSENANLMQKVVNLCYNNLSKRIDSVFTTQTASFIKAITLGDKTGLSYEDKNRFALAGIAHILAISGFHIGIISAIILFILSLFTPNVWLKFVIFSIFVCLFVFITGWQPATIRAGSMAILFMFGRTINKETNMLNVASIILLLVIVINPSLLYSVGFQLSLISVLGIFLFSDIIKEKLLALFKHKLANYIVYSISITLSASIVINPLIAYYFNMFSIISPLTNLLVIPLFSLCLVFAVISIITSFIYFPLGLVYGYIVELLTKLCFQITYIAADSKYSAISYHLYLFIIATIISLCFIYICVSNNNKQFIFRFCIAVFIVASSFFIFDNKSTNEIKLYTKDKYCLLNIPLSDDSSFVWIADRRPNIKDRQKYYNDEGLKKFFQDKRISCIAINGNYGKEFASLHCKHIKTISLSHSQQRQLEQMFLDGKYIYQLE
ncbi:MAG: ComEC family competence protein [Bacteroidetes bacterium]|nr:ComEC family competence protein [Bacteroidota bacterium]